MDFPNSNPSSGILNEENEDFCEAHLNHSVDLQIQEHLPFIYQVVVPPYYAFL
jgi:hypothetical protein